MWTENKWSIYVNKIVKNTKMQSDLNPRKNLHEFQQFLNYDLSS